MTTPAYVRDDSLNASGSYLLYHLPRVTLFDVTAAFGAPGPGYDDPEKGYEHEYRFCGPDGEPVMLYDRWGVWRVGARDPDAARAFADWLATVVPSAAERT